MKRKGPGVMNIILIIVGISLLAFTIEMIRLFKETGMVPDTLVTCVFAALGGECGIMGWIKTSKERHKEHKWEVENREDTQKHEEEMAKLTQNTYNSYDQSYSGYDSTTGEYTEDGTTSESTYSDDDSE